MPLTKNEKWLIGIIAAIILALIEVAFGPLTNHRFTREMAKQEIGELKREVDELKQSQLNKIKENTEEIKEQVKDNKEEHQDIIEAIKSQ